MSATSLDVKTITRAQANDMLKARALERFREDRERRESNIREFEAERKYASNTRGSTSRS
jgi:hypothetical protein